MTLLAQKWLYLFGKHGPTTVPVSTWQVGFDSELRFSSDLGQAPRDGAHSLKPHKGALTGLCLFQRCVQNPTSSCGNIYQPTHCVRAPARETSSNLLNNQAVDPELSALYCQSLDRRPLNLPPHAPCTLTLRIKSWHYPGVISVIPPEAYTVKPQVSLGAMKPAARSGS